MSTADLARQGDGRTAGEPSLDLTTPTPGEIASETSAAIERAEALIRAGVAAANDAAGRGTAPTFEALFGALDDAAREIAIAYGRYASQMLVASDDAVRDAAFAANEQIEAWRNAVPMRDDLVAAVGAFERLGGMDGLGDIEQRYVQRWQRDIRLAGGGLPAADREEIGRISARLVELVSAFQANLAKAPHIRATSDELEGAPDGVRSAATPIDGEPASFDVPVNPGTYLGFVERTPNRALRERAYRAWCTQGVPDNLPLMRETFELRRRMAGLLGYPSWQAYRADNLSAPDAAFINAFIDDLAARLGPIRDREVAAMTEVLRGRPGIPEDFVLQDWDWRYANTIQRDSLGADAERLSEYFEVEHVLAGLAELSAEVFGVRLEARPGRTGWDPGVTAYDLVDVATGRTMAHVFLDPEARTGKQGGAWADWLLPGGGRHGEQRPPTVSLVLNQSRSADGSALLAPREVETLFHEFGHVLNQACSHPPFALHRATWVPFDTIEGPSEFQGRWSLQGPVVARFARHRATGEPIPAELVDAVQRVESLNLSFETMRLLAQVRFDALVHGEAPITIEEAEAQAWQLRGLPWVDGTFYPAGLVHIMGNGYDAALYGYVWAEVIRDDLLERFEAGGLTSPEMGARYREAILSASWLDDPLAAIEAFLGRPWSIHAFLRRASA